MGLQVENLSVTLGGKPILRKLALAAGEARFVGLVGPNGAGKTTLMRAIAGLIPFEGQVRLGGQALDAMASRQRARAIAYLAQGAESHWPLETRRLVALGRLPHLEPFRRPSRADEDAISRAMVLADIEIFSGRDVQSLSGGERARVLLARALAVEAGLLLVDEPVAALDPYHQIRIMEVLRAYADQGRIVIAVMHDLSLASRFCDQLVLLDEGRVMATGTPDEVLTPDNLKSVYRIRAISGGTGDERFVLPVARADNARND
ncbi:MAG: ATP-binding cassette domain-containing protein [Rhizobiales bacterium]|nr:ATP-binding cassette domain-containing protein [Hyphomicrobiales bacterium]